MQDVDTIAQSFANLVRTNNGMFKSEKQAQFLLAKCNSIFGCKEWISVGSVHGNSYNVIYVCDDKGVTKVTKCTKAKGESVEWERVVEGKLSVQDEKEQKRIKREIKRLEKSISDRRAARESGAYSETYPGLYEQSEASDLQQLAGFKAKLRA